jgi:hypothetical protein
MPKKRNTAVIGSPVSIICSMPITFNASLTNIMKSKKHGGNNINAHRVIHVPMNRGKATISPLPLHTKEKVNWWNMQGKPVRILHIAASLGMIGKNQDQSADKNGDTTAPNNQVAKASDKNGTSGNRKNGTSAATIAAIAINAPRSRML